MKANQAMSFAALLAQRDDDPEHAHRARAANQRDC